MEPAVPVELVEQHEPEVPVTSGPAPPAAAVEAGTAAVASAVLLRRLVLRLLVLLGLLEARMSVAAGSNGDNLPLLVLHLQVLALRVERAVNQMVEVVEAEVEHRVLEMVVQTLHEMLLLFRVICDLGRGVASELKETVTVLRHHHSPLK